MNLYADEMIRAWGDQPVFLGGGVQAGLILPNGIADSVILFEFHWFLFVFLPCLHVRSQVPTRLLNT